MQRLNLGLVKRSAEVARLALRLLGPLPETLAFRGQFREFPSRFEQLFRPLLFL